MVAITLWRSPAFAEIAHCRADLEEQYRDEKGFYLNYRHLLISGDDRVIALLNDDGFWQSAASGELYSDISFTAEK